MEPGARSARAARRCSECCGGGPRLRAQMPRRTPSGERLAGLVLGDDGDTEALGRREAIDGWDRVRTSTSVAAATAGDEAIGAQLAATGPVTVSADERLGRAAQLMAEHALVHLGARRRLRIPVGILLTFDVAAVYARVLHHAVKPMGSARRAGELVRGLRRPRV